MDFTARSSPLLSTLSMVALAGVVAPLACNDGNGGPPPIDDFADVIDVQEDFYGFYCQCYAELYGVSADECLAESEIVSDSEEACLAAVFDTNPAAFEVLRCQTEALRGLLACAQAEGCPSPFTCGDGATVPEDYVCDGYPDCADGSDEAQACPAGEMCADGEPISESSVCDGFADCADESDELDCPPPPPPFTCGDGEQVPADYVCDDEADCEDGSDEAQGCPESCERRWLLQYGDCGELGDDVDAMIGDCYDFVCLDGTEIARGQVCDGTPDCAEGEDEQQLCGSGESSSGG